MTHGAVTPLPRIVSADAQIGGAHVPAGTSVAMGTTFVHTNPDIFPDPFKFSPDRWLQPNAKELETYIVTFSKGPRSCIGMNMAWCELYIIFSNLFRKLDMELFETTTENFIFKECFITVFQGKNFHAKVKAKA